MPLTLLLWVKSVAAMLLLVGSQYISSDGCAPRPSSNSLYVIGYPIETHDSHGPRKQKLLARIRRIKGQIERLKVRPNAKVMHLNAGMRGAIAGLMAKVIEDHVREYLTNCDDSHAAMRRVNSSRPSEPI